MSILHLNHRPGAIFDPANQDHRRWYHEFVEHGSWGRCPYRFVIGDDAGNLVTMIQRKLVEYYVQQEFAKKSQRSQQKNTAFKAAAG